MDIIALCWDGHVVRPKSPENLLGIVVWTVGLVVGVAVAGFPIFFVLATSLGQEDRGAHCRHWYFLFLVSVRGPGPQSGKKRHFHYFGQREDLRSDLRAVAPLGIEQVA